MKLCIGQKQIAIATAAALVMRNETLLPDSRHKDHDRSRTRHRLRSRYYRRSGDRRGLNVFRFRFNLGFFNRPRRRNAAMPHRSNPFFRLRVLRFLFRDGTRPRIMLASNEGPADDRQNSGHRNNDARNKNHLAQPV